MTNTENKEKSTGEINSYNYHLFFYFHERCARFSEDPRGSDGGLIRFSAFFLFFFSVLFICIIVALSLPVHHAAIIRPTSSLSTRVQLIAGEAIRARGSTRPQEGSGGNLGAAGSAEWRWRLPDAIAVHCICSHSALSWRRADEIGSHY
jgi:hypothetical protein